MAKHTILFTEEGLDKVKKEHAELQLKRKDAVADLARAREMGDLSENSAYRAARWKLSSIDSRTRHLERLLKSATIVASRHSDEVEIGSTVLIHDGTTNKKFTIVGGYESDLAEGKISFFSPIGKALLHRKVGDTVCIRVPAGEITYSIIEINIEHGYC
ncbi:transcription elongation factor GreA [Candidatus Roizmanbacteria bacterium]|nr:transcription elongation factor GreA [Candidatus Roizmanbacteria bacterium]